MKGLVHLDFSGLRSRLPKIVDVPAISYITTESHSRCTYCALDFVGLGHRSCLLPFRLVVPDRTSTRHITRAQAERLSSPNNSRMLRPRKTLEPSL